VRQLPLLIPAPEITDNLLALVLMQESVALLTSCLVHSDMGLDFLVKEIMVLEHKQTQIMVDLEMVPMEQLLAVVLAVAVLEQQGQQTLAVLAVLVGQVLPFQLLDQQ
jgi:hypothetical protein